jgi:hypothetical protein
MYYFSLAMKPYALSMLVEAQLLEILLQSSTGMHERSRLATQIYDTYYVCYSNADSPQEKQFMEKSQNAIMPLLIATTDHVMTGTDSLLYKVLRDYHEIKDYISANSSPSGEQQSELIGKISAFLDECKWERGHSYVRAAEADLAGKLCQFVSKP